LKHVLNLGAGRVKGKVITFLDAHCECTDGWLEPLLYEIYNDRSVIIFINIIKIRVNSYFTQQGSSRAVPMLKRKTEEKIWTDHRVPTQDK